MNNKTVQFAPSEKPIIFSFFSGCGFLDLGFEKSDFDIRFVNEYHKPFHDAYRYARKKMNIPEPMYGYHLGSIEEFFTAPLKNSLKQLIKQSQKDNIVGFIGGPPCPDFSVAGKNKGRNGDKGKLTEAYIDIIVTFKPDFFLLENVKGLISNKKHFAFYNEIKAKLENSGYILTDRMINGIEVGVPQDRDRILLFGIKKTKMMHNQRNKLAENFNWNAHIKFDKKTILNKELWPDTTPYSANSILKQPILPLDALKLTIEYWFRLNNVNNHANANHHFKPRSGLSKMQTISEGDVSRKSFKRLHRWRYSPTAAYGNNEVHLHPYQDRRLSISEAMAIQSLPKEFELPNEMTLTDMFKTVGNGVPYLMAEAIAKTIRDFLKTI
ncbi:DNA cytosine methyltransferase [Providencia rettgeri]